MMHGVLLEVTYRAMQRILLVKYNSVEIRQEDGATVTMMNYHPLFITNSLKEAISFPDTSRVSRVSFANDLGTRPSTDSRRTTGTVGSARTPRALHTVYPPIPSLPPAYSPNEKVAHCILTMSS